VAASNNYSLPILVTGAAGRIGSVGRLVTEQLLGRGFCVRAQVRVDDDRAAALRSLGADVVVGDLLDLEAAHRAVEGCDRIYCGLSIAPTYLEAAINLAAVVKHHRASAFVNISQMTVKEMDIHATTHSPQQKQHWLFEQVLSWSGLPVVEVRPTAFLEGLFLQLAGGVATQDQLLAPLGNGKNSAIAAFDVARSVTAILSNPAKHIGKTYHLTGPSSQDMQSIAKEFSQALGRPITYVDVPLDVWKEALSKMGLPPHVVSHVVTMAELHQANRYDRYSDDVEALTGVRPMGVREFVKRNAQAFTRGNAQ
jgi:uncharacterized protein YbjT (DUF2867 family)